MSVADLLHELARPARHDHRRLTTGQRVAENLARAAATGLALTVHAGFQLAARAADTGRTIHLIAHLWRDR